MMRLSKQHKYLIIIIIFSLIIRFLWLYTLIERDEGVFGFIGNSILGGKVLYKDVFDTKPPFLHLIYAGLIFFFGNSIIPIRIFNNLLFIFSTILFFSLSKKLYTDSKPLIATIFFCLLMNLPVFEGQLAMSESLAQIFMMVGLFFHYKSFENKKRKNIFLILTSILYTFATFINQYFSFLFLPVLFHIWSEKNEKLIKLKQSLFILFPPILVFSLLSLYFYLKNILVFFWIIFFPYLGPFLKSTSHFFYLAEGMTTYTTLYYSIESLKLVLLESSFFIILSILGLFKLSSKKTKQRKFILTYFVFLFVSSIFPPGFGHYYIRVIPFIAFLCLEGVFFILKIQNKLKKKVIVGILILILVFNLFIVSLQYPNYNFKFKNIEWNYNDYESYDEQILISNFLMNNTSENDAILIWGNNFETYWLSSRDSINLLNITYNCKLYVNDEKLFLKTYDLLKNNNTNLKYIIKPNFYTLDCYNKKHGNLFKGILNESEFELIGNTKIYKIINS